MGAFRQGSLLPIEPIGIPGVTLADQESCCADDAAETADERSEVWIDYRTSAGLSSIGQDHLGSTPSGGSGAGALWETISFRVAARIHAAAPMYSRQSNGQR